MPKNAHITFISAGAGSGKTYRLTEILHQELLSQQALLPPPSHEKLRPNFASEYVAICLKKMKLVWPPRWARPA